MSLDRRTAPNPYDFLPPVPAFDLTSDDVVGGASTPLTHVHGSAGGENLSPQLAWSDPPEGTLSFVVTCFDPDAPTPSGFWHWSAVDLPVSVTELARGAGSGEGEDLPAGAFHVANDFGNSRYDGAAPPPGDQLHRYFFVVHAVDVPTLGVTPSTGATAVAFNLVFHTLARAILTPVFSY